jgi:hypothetical protein
MEWVKVENRKEDHCAQERSQNPLQGLSFWEHYLPWALATILPATPRGIQADGENTRYAGHGLAAVC